MLHRNSFFAPLLALVIICAAGIYLFSTQANPAPNPNTQMGAANAPLTTATSNSSENTEPSSVTRIEHPYKEDPLPFSEIESRTRSALVNIVCTSKNNSLPATSGSGVIIDPRGVILTNAHVAQYVLLSESPLVDLSCVVRVGSPAVATWNAEVLFIPPIWVQKHAKDLLSTPLVTGEHDYALLHITHSVATGLAPSALPFLMVDTREAIGFLADEVVVGGYPAEFAPTSNAPLYPETSITAIQELLTFANTTVDLMSLGGVPEAQSGSSGGPVVNAWGRLVGLVSTTSDAPTTAERDLRALTLAYIDRDLKTQSGLSLADTLAGDVTAQAAAFRKQKTPQLLQLLIAELKKSR